MRLFAIGLAGAVGALARYGIGAAVGARSFPWATLGVNIAGSLLLGVVLVAGSTRLSQDTMAAVAVGFLGAFTTFSTFSYETQELLRFGRVGAACAYVALSVVAGVAGAALGYGLGRVLSV